MCKQIFCLCLSFLFLSFPFAVSATDKDVCFSLADTKTQENGLYEISLSSDSKIAAFVAHLEFDENAIEFMDAKAVNSSAELSVNYQNDGKLSMAYLMKNGTKGELITLCFNLKDSNASINLTVEQVIDSMGNEISVPSVKGAEITLTQGFSESDTVENTRKSTEALTKTVDNSPKDSQTTSASGNESYIFLPAKEGRDFTPIMLMAGGFTLTLGIGVIAFILGRGTNKTNEKDKYEKDT